MAKILLTVDMKYPAATYAWFAQEAVKWTARGGKYKVTLKNCVVFRTNAQGVRYEDRRATQTYNCHTLRDAEILCQCAIRGRLCQEARLYDAERNRIHTLTRGRRTWKPTLPEKSNS